MSAAIETEYGDSDLELAGNSKEFLTVIIGKQRFGIPILQVQDVLGDQRITNIPKAPPEVAGALNLRGRVVTAIDVRKRLGIGAFQDAHVPESDNAATALPEHEDTSPSTDQSREPTSAALNAAGKKKIMSVVVEHENELYSLIIDNVGDVLALQEDTFESNPPTLDPAWKEISLGIFRLETELLIILDVPKLLDTVGSAI